MTTSTQLLATGLDHHRAGRLEDAEKAYRELMATAPDQSDAWHLLGVIAFQRGEPLQAIELITRAISLDAGQAHYHDNRARALEALKRHDEAIASFRRVVALTPDVAEGHNNLGNCLWLTGRHEEALRCFQRALLLDPHFDLAYNNLGNALKSLGRVQESLSSYQRALALNPTFAEAHCNLGAAFGQLGDQPGALACYERALMLRPDLPVVHYNRANALNTLGRREEAVAGYQRALALSPRYADAENNLGCVLRRLGRVEEGMTHLRQAIAIDPRYAEAHCNLGESLQQRGERDEAAACYERALAIRADYPDAHANRAMLRLLKGDFEQGWPEYEWRYYVADFKAPRVAQPRWDGSDLTGRSIVLYAEQGLGDALQFVRYAPLVRARGGRVLLACTASLTRLLATCPGIDAIIEPRQPPPFDVHTPLLSLPYLFHTNLTNIPAEVPYFHPPVDLVDAWATTLPTVRELRVAIAWQGSPTHLNDRSRSVPLTQFEPLLRVPGVRFGSLQMGAGADQLAAFPEILDLGSRVTDFMDTAAALRHIDLVIAVDTALVHLAGALGIPTWVALPYAPDWRWLLERDDSPWYPTLRLFRQTQLGAWEEVFARMARELAGQVAIRSRVEPRQAYRD